MKEYIKPQIDVVVFETADVLMTSGEQLIVDEPVKGNNYGNVYSQLG